MAHRPEEPDRLRRIVLRNIRCFEHVDVSFCDDDTQNPVSWTLLLGDNSTGKSTLLQAIALGLASPKEALALFEMDNRHEWLRYGTDKGEITVELARGLSEPTVLRTRIDRASYGERIERLAHGADPPFLCGYGAARRSFATDSPRGYTLRDAVETLFDPDASLQNPELSLRRQGRVSETNLLHRIDCLLNLPEGSTRLDVEGLQVRGPWGTFLPVNALSDGYRATLAWILDMLGWVLLHKPEMLDGQIEGLVLIDEVEQHLHPSWQRKIIRQLHKQFPGLQFVATTHAPLCVTGTTDLEDAEVNLVHLRWEGDSVEARDRLKPPRGQRADQILTSYLFGLETTSDDRTTQQVQRLSTLLARGKRASDEERDEIERLRGVLQDKLGSEETELSRKSSGVVERALDDALRGRVRERLSRGRETTFRSLGLPFDVAPDEGMPVGTRGASADAEATATEFEIRRQMKELLK
jgi:AAA domain, putative AbiEii toxin, Type IV TA system/AAA domain